MLPGLWRTQFNGLNNHSYVWTCWQKLNVAVTAKRVTNLISLDATTKITLSFTQGTWVATKWADLSLLYFIMPLKMYFATGKWKTMCIRQMARFVWYIDGRLLVVHTNSRHFWDTYGTVYTYDRLVKHGVNTRHKYNRWECFFSFFSRKRKEQSSDMFIDSLQFMNISVCLMKSLFSSIFLKMTHF